MTRNDGLTMAAPDSADECCASGGQPLLAATEAAGLAEIFKALSDPTRVRLVTHVAAVPGGTVCACHLPDELGISQPTLSHHLKKLVDAGILTRDQRGRWAHYVLTPGSLDGVVAFLSAPGRASGQG